jgi:RNA polymerase sigma-70 factor (ECF subfamily)
VTAGARPGTGSRGRPPRAAGQVSASVGPRRLLPAESEDLAYQATADAVLAITAKLGQFRGESRFTTWACKFVILEVPAKIGQHFWRRPEVRWTPRTGTGCRVGSVSSPPGNPSGGICLPRCAAPWTPSRSRGSEIFVAIVVNGVPLDALVVRLGSNCNAIHKMMFDARRRLRTALAAFSQPSLWLLPARWSGLAPTFRHRRNGSTGLPGPGWVASCRALVR